jgi:DNA-binding beta-propeller fold protein YncE
MMRRAGIPVLVAVLCLMVAATASGFGFVRSWGTEGIGPGQFESPSAVAVDATGNVYVADTANNRIQKFDAQGNFLLAWGSVGTGDGQFNHPQGITVNGAGDVFVADTLNSRFQKFSPNGTFLLKRGTFGTGNSDQYAFPVGIGSQGATSVLVADTANARVFRLIDSLVRDLTFGTLGLSNPTDAAGGMSAVFVAEAGSDSIRVLNATTGAILTSFGGLGTAPNRMSGPASVDVVPGGGPIDTVWVADTGNNRISSWHAQGANPADLQFTFGSAGSCPGEFSGPRGIAVTAAGEVYVADTANNRIVELGPSGDPSPACGPPPAPEPPAPEPPATPDTDPPQASIDAPLKVKSRKKRATVSVSFTADEPAGFACRVDGSALAACSSPLELTLKRGTHLLEVIATDVAGNSDPQPPVASIKVIRKHRHK